MTEEFAYASSFAATFQTELLLLVLEVQHVVLSSNLIIITKLIRLDIST